MNTITRNLMVFFAILSAMMFGTNGTKVSGEFSSAITFGDVVSFTTPYTGIELVGNDWELSTNLSNGMVTIEEALFKWAITDKVTATFGNQALPYGIYHYVLKNIYDFQISHLWIFLFHNEIHIPNL